MVTFFQKTVWISDLIIGIGVEVPGLKIKYIFFKPLICIASFPEQIDLRS